MEMNMDKEPITVNGLQNLKAELEDLKNVQRPKVVEAIAEARSHGDLKENAEYHAAKEQQALIESRVIAINDIIARANVIDVTKIENDGKVIFGSTVELKDLDGDKIIKYKLVGQDEADIKKKFIFFKSPIGKALVGKDIGEMITVNTPSGEKNFEILNVEYI
jgi:transcription elongation factor GreA